MAFLRTTLGFALGSDVAPPVPSPPPPPPRGGSLDPAAPNAEDLGIDIDCLEDLSPTFELVTGNKALGQAIGRRYLTERGSLFYDQSYGSDLRDQLNDSFQPGGLFAMKNAIEREAENDERVEKAAAVVDFDSKTQSLSAKVQITSPNGPFDLTMKVGSLTTEILAAP